MLTLSLVAVSGTKGEVSGRGRACDNPRPVDPQRKRKIRLVVALATAVLLAAALVYTSFSASSEAKEPSQLIGAAPGASYDLTGKVVPGSVQRRGGTLLFRVVDREGGGPTLPVSYRGTVPDPFRGGREIVLTGEKVEDGTFVGEPDTLVTKCPSKFTTNES
jgi:cytochrome c-type biogenesis protein CcmE